MSTTVVLLGDSIFDNGAYVRSDEPDVPNQLREKLRDPDWRVEMRAVDGDRATDVPRQLQRSPVAPPCIYVLSVGGNDALDNAHLLVDETQRSFAATMLLLYELRERFRENYTETLDCIVQRGQPLIACTIYNGNFPQPELSKATEAALSAFNDVIVEEALRRRLDLIDLRSVCDCPEDYANPIEPSAIGGAKIADAIIRIVAPQAV